jgi:hypothetical protein
MSDTAATPETGAVDAPASMDSVLAEFEAGTSKPEDDAVDSAVRELVNEAEEGDAEEAADDGEATEPKSDDVAEEAPDGDEEEASAPELDLTRLVTVKVDGEDVQVPLSEALKGYSREADYSRKTMALAEERKGIEARISTDYANQLEQATNLFIQTDPILAEANQIDWQALAREDPATYTQLRAAVDARMQVIGQARQEIQRVAEEREQREAETYKTGVQETEAAIRASDPAFSDDVKFSAYVKETVTELGNLGLDGDDMKVILSNPTVGPKALSLVNDALQWRAQQKAKAALPAKKIVPAPAKPLRADASEGSKPTRRAPPSGASRDRKVDWAVQEFLKEEA